MAPRTDSDLERISRTLQNWASLKFLVTTGKLWIAERRACLFTSNKFSPVVASANTEIKSQKNGSKLFISCNKNSFF